MHHEGTFVCSLDAPDDGFDDLRCTFGPIDVKFPVKEDAEVMEDEVEDVEGGMKTLTLIGNPKPETENVDVKCDSVRKRRRALTSVPQLLSLTM